jgi:protein TonB
MQSASEQPSSDQQPSSEQRRFPRRIVALIITLIIHALLMLMLLNLATFRKYVPMGSSRLISVSVSPNQDDAARSKSQTKTKQAAAKAQAAAPRTAPPAPVPPPNPVPSVPDYPVMRISPDEMASLDNTMRTQHAPASADAGGSGQSDSAKAGSGPQGQQLYAAEWYREPTDTELRFYMPKNVIGYGDIGCRTVARFHVEDCVILGESPRGSGLGYAVSQAAWQFLVRPPRINGHYQVGEWVKIRIELIDTGRINIR